MNHNTIPVLWIIGIVFLLVEPNLAADTVVNDINPKTGSLNGGTRITIDGNGFARDQFSFGAGQEHVGNAITMVSSTRTFPCPIHLDGSHEQQLMCYTEAMPEDDYFIRVSVDGVDVPEGNHCASNINNCKFRPKTKYTPTIDSVTPRSGKPGTKMKISGMIVTDRYGSNLPASSNGLDNKLLRVYLGGQSCDLKDLDTDEFFGLELDNHGKSWDGHMICKEQGTFIGHVNGSFLVEHFGRSLPHPNVLRISSTGDVHMFQTYTGISSISHNSGSKAGGLELTIYGKHFDETRAPVKVMVGETECKVTKPIKDGEIVCKVAAESNQPSSVVHPGNRGITHHIWNATTKSSSTIDEISALTTSAADHSSSVVEEMEFSLTDMFNYVDRMEGFFIPPKTTDYLFYIRADDQAKLYLSTDTDPANKVLIAQSTLDSTYFKDAEQVSSSIALVAGNSYYIEVIHRQGSSGSKLKVAARMMETVFTDGASGMVWNEKQKGVFSSTVDKDVITFTVTPPASSKKAVSEVQTVTVTAPVDATFRLGLFKAYTGLLTVSSSGDDIAKAIQALPGVQPDTVTATSTPSATGSNIVVTFLSSKGDLPDMTYLISDAFSQVSTIVVAEKTKGVPSLEGYQFIMEGVPSPTVSPTATASEVKAALLSMFSVQCPKVLGNPSGTTYFEDYENSVSGNHGTPVSNIEPFCGRKSGKNPHYIFHKGGSDADVLGKPLSQYKALCLAYKGSLKSIGLRFSYEDGGGVVRRKAISWSVTAEKPEQWVFVCYDLLAKVKASKADASDYRADWITVSRTSTEVPLYIDSVSLARDVLTQDPDASNQRMPASKPNGALIRDVTVTSSTSGVYEITIDSYECGNNFPLFEIANAKVNSGSSAQKSNAAEFSLCNGGTCLKGVIARTTRASVPIGGTFTITNQGKVSPVVPVTATAKQLEEELESLSEFGDLLVTRTGDCANFEYTIKWMSKGGNQPLVTLDSSLVTGNAASATVEPVTDGSLWYDPIPADMLRVKHDKPQVRLHVNKVPCSCDGNCDFEWTTGSTPTVESLQPTSGTLAQGTIITIDGTGFDETAANNTVMIGGIACTPTESSSVMINCTVGNGPAGSHAVSVFVAGKGLANGSLTFTYVSAITSLVNASSGIAGGTELTINGYGFMDGATVTVGGSDCPVKSSSPGLIVCITPQSATTSGNNATVIVIQSPGVTLTSDDKHFYDDTLGSTITSIDKSSSPIEGGETLTIVGTGFTSSAKSINPVRIGANYATIVSYTDTQIVVKTPSNKHGSYPVMVKVDGYADLRQNNISNIDYTLQVTNVSPSQGSLYGGTRVTVTGVGFPTTTSLINLKFGAHRCVIENATATTITCLIEDTGTVHEIKNTGKHPNHGYGYSWEPKHKEVKVGDKMKWSWSYARFINGIATQVAQTVNASTTEQVEGGFFSGPKVKKGMYEYRVTKPGTFDYWSGYADEFDIIYFRGTIKVAPLVSHSQQMELKVAGHEAEYQPGGANPSSTGNCPGTVAVISGCTDTAPASNDSTKFFFKFWSCVSPVVTNMDRDNGTADDDITFTGKGFGSNACENELSLGNAAGIPQSSAATSLVVKVDPASDIPIGIRQQPSLRVGNLGFALMDLTGNATAKDFGLLPWSSGLSPTTGSVNGGTKITISGSGFVGSTSDITVTVDAYQCNVESVSYTQIVCSTPALAAGTYDVAIVVAIGGNQFPVSCSACSFTYADSDTPTVTGATPTTIDGPEVITINGTGFSSTSSKVNVKIGGETCTVSSATTTELICNIAGLPNGNHSLEVDITDKGKATSSIVINSPAVVTSITPSTGSIHGGQTITISGNGFTSISNTTVDINGKSCVIKSVSFFEIVCTTPDNSQMEAAVAIKSNGHDYTVSQGYNHTISSSPTVTSITPTSGLAGSTVTISGTGYNADQNNNTVTIGGVPCTVTSSSVTSVVCTLGDAPAGDHAVTVLNADTGFSDSATSFTYEMIVTNRSPASVSASGGLDLTLTGSGFVTSDMEVKICNENCTLNTMATQSATEYRCIIPPSATAVVSTTACDIVVKLNAVTQTLTSSNAITYSNALTPEITGVSPARGGTAGGTSLTVTGTGFGASEQNVNVTIDGIECTVTNVTDTHIECTTGAAKSSDTKVNVFVDAKGNAKQTSASFHYIDVWSSQYTWGNAPPPTMGDLVVIPKNQTILLDTSTPVLKMLIIQGGKVIFDEKDIELQAEYILITDGGVLQVGTEEAPFQHKGIITLFGHQRSKELPIYGAKVLAVREGTLDLHGRPTHVTWTRLAATADVGATTLQLLVPVEWQVNDWVVIATTGHRHSQKETEKRQITAISGDKQTLTLNTALEYKHIGITETYDGQNVEFRAEVGLLTHNVVVRGSRLSSWEETIEACPAGFNTGEFATQTCFQGRFGEEMGSDQFGAQIIMHAPRKDEDLVVGRLSYVEVNYAGQAFRLGRYPVHFHLNGVMTKSYVRGLGIHQTFNRAVNVHNTHSLLIEHTVIYNIMGGAFFLEDGIETGNVFQYNLALFVRSSSSLLNDDVTPAAFWATNPNNTFRHNTAAGGTHFGFWYRMHNHPEGPSRTDSVCPKHVPLGEFFNNTIHAQGWFGLWVFPDYFPREGGSCSTSAPFTPAVFEGTFAWNNEKGIEFVNAGACQAKDSILVNNEFAGVEWKLVINSPQYTDQGAMVRGGLIVGKGTNLAREKGTCTRAAIILPYHNGFQVKGTKFVNFNDNDCSVFRSTLIDGTCNDKCGGYYHQVDTLSFVNADRKVFWSWKHEAVIKDMDGSLTGSAGYSLIPTAGILDPAKCTAHAQSSISSVDGSICEASVKFHRFSFNNIKPSSLEGKNVNFTNQHGWETGPFMTKRISHKPGWAVILPTKESYDFEFEDGEHLTNISFTGAFYQFAGDDAIIMSQKVEKKPDRFMIDGSTSLSESSTDLDLSTNKNGDWRFSSDDMKVRYIVAASTSRKKRGAILNGNDRSYNLKVIRCFYKDCIPPPDPLDLFTTPNTTYLWSDPEAWKEMGTTKPVEGGDVTIDRDFWFILDESPPKLGKVIINGGLEFQNNISSNLVFNADLIYLKGRLVAGWEHTPFEGKAEIILHGEHSTPAYPVSDGPQLGSKFLAVFGGLELHGKNHSVQWTRLSETANIGTNQIKLQDAVSWGIGDEIVIAPTSLSAWNTETFSITAVSADQKTLTLNSSLAFKHIYYTETLPTGQTYTLAAEVGHLTRNVKIRGKEYPNMMKESFGARVVVGRTAVGAQSYVGFGRFSNVEFVNAGQEGWTESYDPRFAVSFMDVAMKAGMPSFVKSCAFNSGFSVAIGVFGTNDLLVENNVVYRTVEHGLVSNSAKTNIRGNLLILNQWSGSYRNRFEPKNIRYPGSVELIEATEPVLVGNVVAGAERIGFHVLGESCSGTSVEAWSGNEVHSSIIGVGLLPTDPSPSGSCTKWSGFFFWKSVDFGIFYNNQPSIQIDDVISAENRVGIFTFVVGPGASTFGDKTASVENSLVVGHTPSFDCAFDVMDSSDDNIKLSGQGRSFGNGSNGVVGMSMTTFNAGSNNSPEKPLKNIMAYNSMNGFMKIENVTFARFGQYCGGNYDYCITTNPSNDDGHHPVETNNLKFSNVGEDNKIYLHIPSVGKINSADCVDMDCDGKKKNIITDTDGSLLGRRGTVISWSEYQWGGDRRRGLADDRIPKVLLSDGDGNKRDVNAFAPKRGLVRNDQCVFHDYWRAYECHDIEHKLFLIESKDADTETRRISPVAVLSDGYLDLINGPQDHGWCSGYTCRKRLSTFQAIVALDKFSDIYFTGTTPQHLRFYLLDVNSTQGIRIAVSYATPNRLDVFVNGQYLLPKNGEMKNGKFILKPPTTSVEFMPMISEPTGTNYVKRDENMIFVVIKGTDHVDIKLASVVIVSFSLPAMTVDDFFGENLVANLAAFLGVDPRKVRIVNVVSENSRRRRKRTVSTTKIVVEIGDEPNDNSPMSYESLTQVSENITNQAQLGAFDDIVNATVLGVSTIEPTPPASDPTWMNVTSGSQENVLTVASGMEFYEPVVPGKEQNVMVTAPRIRVKDTMGNYMTVLGASSSPWQLTATLRSNSGSDSRSVLGGTTTVTFVEGWANFTDLTLSHAGTGYIIDFQVTTPVGAANFTLSTSALTIPSRGVTAHLVSVSTSLLENQNIELILDLRDDDTSSVITNIDWRNHTWHCVASLADPSLYYGTLSGTTNLTFDTTTARVAYQNLSLSAIGTYFLDFHVYTDPAEYDFHYEKKVTITNAAKNAIVVGRTNVLEVKLDGVYNASTANYIGAKVMNYYVQLFMDSLIRITGYSVSAGSILVSMTVEGDLNDMNSTAYELCSSVENATTFTYGNSTMNLLPYMNMDGSAFYGVSCGPIPKDNPDKDDGLHPGIIAALVILSLALIAVIVAFISWKCCVVPKTKTHDSSRQGKYLGYPSILSAEDSLFSEKSFLGVGASGASTPVPPVDTSYTLPLDRHNHKLKFKM